MQFLKLSNKLAHRVANMHLLTVNASENALGSSFKADEKGIEGQHLP